MNGLLDLFYGWGLVRCEVFHRAIVCSSVNRRRRWGVQDSDHRSLSSRWMASRSRLALEMLPMRLSMNSGVIGRRISALPSCWNCRSY